jgi:hypothetical protein
MQAEKIKTKYSDSELTEFSALITGKITAARAELYDLVTKRPLPARHWKTVRQLLKKNKSTN